MSEFPEPWHRINPAVWPRVEKRIIMRVGSERDPDRARRLRRMLPAPRLAPKLAADESPYRTDRFHAFGRLRASGA